jgi:hypothetical protein
MNARRLLPVALLLLLAPPVLGALLLWLSPQRGISGLQLLVERFSPYSLELRNPVLTWSPLHFSADLALLRLRGEAEPPVVSAQQLDLRVPLSQLLSGHTREGRFVADNISYYLDTRSGSEPLDLEGLFAPLSRLPGEIEIRSAHLISRREELWIFPINDIRGRRTRDGSLQATAVATVGERASQLEAVADWQAVPGGSHRLDLDATLRDTGTDSELHLAGTIEARGSQLRYSMDLDGHYRNVGDFLRALDSDAYAVDGNLDVRGTMQGDVERYTLSISELTLGDRDDYRFTASGLIRREGSAPATLDLSASGNAQRIEALAPVPEELAALLERSAVELVVAGTLRSPTLSSASLVLYGSGDTRLTLTTATDAIDLAGLQDLSFDEQINATFEFRSRDLRQWLAVENLQLPGTDLIGASASGSLAGTREDIRLDVAAVAITHPAYTLEGRGKALWQAPLLSAPELELTLRERAGPGRLTARGAIADLAAMRGIALQLEAADLRPAPLLGALGIADDVPLEALSGSALALRASDPVLLRDIDLLVSPVADMRWQISGEGQLLDGTPEADLQLALRDGSDNAWREFGGLPRAPDSASGQLRLRPRYATLLGAVSFGSTEVQAVATTGLADGEIIELALDLYAPTLRLADFAGTEDPTARTEPVAREASDPLAFRDSLPAYPIHLTLRSDGISGELSRFEQFSLSLEGIDRRFLLRQFDTRYAGGELILRGLLDLNTTPPALSLAGQGIRIPLAALVEDLGLQEAVTGLLSVRGGLSTRGDTAAAWRSRLQGRLAAAVTETTVSGPAYDLLMSNLLSWIVRGANEKSTTFDCSMAQFDILDGVARSDSVYIETPRMLATGKARIDLPESTLEVRIEPRSKNRTIQFPSAVRIVGPLDAPEVKISPLQTTADLSAQALLLLPSLTLKLFGIGADAGVPRPCNPGTP